MSRVNGQARGGNLNRKLRNELQAALRLAETSSLAEKIALDRFGKSCEELTDEEVFQCSVAAGRIRREKLLRQE